MLEGGASIKRRVKRMGKYLHYDETDIRAANVNSL